MGHQDRRGTQMAQNSRDFPAHLRTEVGVQAVKGLIEKHHPWAGASARAKSDALLLAA